MSRFAYDTLAASFDRVLAERRESQADAQQRYDALLERYHQLKLQGHTAPDPTPTPPISTPADPVEHALADTGRGLPPELRAARRAQAEADLKGGMSPLELAMRIRSGHRVQDEYQ